MLRSVALSILLLGATQVFAGPLISSDKPPESQGVAHSGVSFDGRLAESHASKPPAPSGIDAIASLDLFDRSTSWTGADVAPATDASAAWSRSAGVPLAPSTAMLALGLVALALSRRGFLV